MKETVVTGPMNDNFLSKEFFGVLPQEEFVLLKQYIKDREFQTALRLGIQSLANAMKKLNSDHGCMFRGGLMKKNLGLSENIRVTSKARGLTADQQGFQPYIRVWESELQFMAGLAARWGSIETGGEVYGLFSHAGRMVIELATPPGPNSIHEVVQFRQDLDFFQKTNAFLMNNFGILYGGNFHSHHLLGIKGPSHGDVQSTNSIAQRNGYKRLCQFVLTFENDAHRQNDHFRNDDCIKYKVDSKDSKECSEELPTNFKAGFMPSGHTNFIRIHSFLYLDPARGEPVRCSIRIIKGTSPFRRAIMRNSKIPELAKPYTFPMSRILFDAFNPPHEPGDHDLELPARISKQCLQLPEYVREKIGVVQKEGLIVLSLPLNKGTLFVAFNGEPPNRIEAVYCSQNRKGATPIEISKEALCFGPYTELTRIYERVVRLVEREGSARKADEGIGIEERVQSLEGQSKGEEVVNGGEE